MSSRKYTKKDVADHYDEYSELYENWSGLCNGGYHYGIMNKFSDIFHNDRMVRNLSNYVIDVFDINTNDTKTILDAGCGSGDVSQIIKKRYKKTIVYAVTLSKNQYEISRKKHEKQKDLNILQGDFEQTGLDDEKFDIVFFIDSICCGEGYDKEPALRESYRILKSGGQLVICDAFLQKDYDNWSRWFNFVNNQVIDLWHINTWSIESDIRKKAEEIGFSDYYAKELTWRIVPSVLHIIFTKIAWALVKMIRSPKYIKELVYFLRLSVFAPLLGIHPNFCYKVVTLKKK